MRFLGVGVVLVVALTLPGCAIFDSAEPGGGLTIERTYQANKDGTPLAYKDENENPMFAEILQKEKIRVSGTWLEKNTFNMNRSQDTNTIDMNQVGDGSNAYLARVSDNNVTANAIQNTVQLARIAGELSMAKAWLSSLTSQSADRNDTLKNFLTPNEHGVLPDASILNSSAPINIPKPEKINVEPVKIGGDDGTTKTTSLNLTEKEIEALRKIIKELE